MNPLDIISTSVNSIGGSNAQSLPVLIKNILNILFFIIGIAAVIVLIIGGLRYVFSSGDEKGVTAAKNTILYAIVGLVVAVLAFSIVNFVLGGLGGQTTP